MSVSAGAAWWMASEQKNGSDSLVTQLPGPQFTELNVSTAGAVTSVEPGSIEAVISTIEQRFKQSRPDISIANVEPSRISGLYRVKVQNGPVLYATSDGAYFVMGDLFQTMPGGFVNIAEQAREGERAQSIAQVDVANMIVFAPEQQPSKAVINVFTDVDCYFCQKLHQEVPDLNRAGIEVRYLAFPRAGIGSESYKKIASAWCAENQRSAMTKLKNRQRIEINVCEGNPVTEQYELGQQIGVTGTPAIVTEKGQLIPGYRSTLDLAQALGVAVAPELASELARKQAEQVKK